MNHHPRTLDYRREALTTAALEYADAETDTDAAKALSNLLAAATRWATPARSDYEARPFRYCVECRRYQPIAAKGLCFRCYKRARRAA